MRINRHNNKNGDEPIHLSEGGLEKLQNELAHLRRVLPERIAETARTAAYGDRSDNAEYKQAKGTLRATRWRILEIEDQLKRVIIIEPKNNIGEVVQLGSTVTLGLKDTERIFQILGPHETNPSGGCISYESPLGKALMGRKSGDIIVLETNNGKVNYTILNVR